MTDLFEISTRGKGTAVTRALGIISVNVFQVFTARMSQKLMVPSLPKQVKIKNKKIVGLFRNFYLWEQNPCKGIYSQWPGGANQVIRNFFVG